MFGVRFARVPVRGRTLWVDLHDRTLGRYFFVFQDYEPFEATLLERAAGPGATVVDIGANVGFYTVLLASRVGPGGRVIAIEPDPTNASLLRRSAAANDLGNVTFLEAAVLDRAGTIDLYRSKTNFGDHRVFDGAESDGAGREKVTVPAVVLDEYLERERVQPTLVKMDIQGAEVTAFPGMIRTLSDPRVVLFCEFWPQGLRLAGSNAGAFLDSLHRAGLTLFEIREEDRTVVPVDRDELENRYPDTGLSNLIGVHPEGIASLERTLGVALAGAEPSRASR